MGIKFNALTGKLDLSAGSTLPTESGIPSYTSADLPWSAAQGQQAFNTTIGAPVYFSNGDWKKYSDDSVVLNRTIDIFILAGQSNAHGNADVAGLTPQQATHTGLFYSSWHDNTSNAETTQYFSGIAEQLVAGSTRGDSSKSTLGSSPYFGPEIGFVSRANAINLTGNAIGVLKYAVGASTLNAGTALSDWDTTATGYQEGDCWRGLQAAIADCVSNLDAAGYAYNFKGLIWWQGESGATVSGLQTFISAFRNLMGTTYGVANSSQFPVVITKIGYGVDLTPVATADAYVGIVDAGAFGHSGTNNHIGTAALPDTTGNGVNDMFDIGEAYADQMQLAISGNTNAAWSPADITTRLWLDMDDQSTQTLIGGYVNTIADKSANSYSFTAAAGATISQVGSGQNGKNILRFDGNSDFTSATNIAFSPTAKHKWFFVLKVTNSDANDAIISAQKSGLQLIMFNFAGAGNFKAQWYVNPGNGMLGNTTNLLNQWVMLAVEWDVPNLQSSAWLNGTAYNTAVAQSGLSVFGAMNVTLNKYQNVGDADWGELVFVEDPTQANSEKIEGYLAHKWGLAGNLPAGHPYKTSAP